MRHRWRVFCGAAAVLAVTFTPAASGDEAAEYEEIVRSIREELSLRFQSPDDPKLAERRVRLRALFNQIPPSRAGSLRDRLGSTATRDELSKLFHGRLATATRREMLAILETKIAEAEKTEAPAASDDDTIEESVPVWPTRPLPESERSRLERALDTLERKVGASDDKRKWRYECWIKKLRQPGADDRVIEWSRICPAKTGAIGAAYLVGPCDLTKGTPVSQDAIDQNIKAISDVDSKGVEIGIVTHLKASIVVSEEMTALPLENLRATHDRVVEAIDKLEKWANNPAGGSSGMANEYVAIKDWIGRRQRDQASVYNCQ